MKLKLKLYTKMILRKKMNQSLTEKLSTYLVTLVFLGFFILLTYKSSNSETTENLGGVTLLMKAANADDLDGVKFFSRAGSSTINQKNIGGATALHIASRNNNLEIVKTLIKSGADINATDNDKWTPLMRAASFGNKKIVSELLISGANASKVNNIGETSIIHSTNSRCNTCLESILSYINYQFMDDSIIEKQFEEAFVIANKKRSESTKKILSDFKKRISLGQYPNTFNNNMTKNLAELKGAPNKATYTNIVNNKKFFLLENQKLFDLIQKNKRRKNNLIANQSDKRSFYFIKPARSIENNYDTKLVKKVFIFESGPKRIGNATLFVKKEKKTGQNNKIKFETNYIRTAKLEDSHIIKSNTPSFLKEASNNKKILILGKSKENITSFVHKKSYAGINVITDNFQSNRKKRFIFNSQPSLR